MRQVNLYTNIPDFMQNYREIKVIFDLENKELTNEWEEIEKAFNNNFIYSTNLQGIANFEKMMGIYPKKESNLKERQNEVFIKWNSKQHYTWVWLKGFLKSYFETTKTIAIPVLDNKKYHLDIRLKSNKEFTDYEYRLFDDLRLKIPANLTLTILGVLPVTKEKQKIGSALVFRLKKIIEDKATNQVCIGEFYAKTGLIYRMNRRIINV